MCPGPLSENLGIDFYSGFRKKNPGIHFYSGFREKNRKGLIVAAEILRNPGIDFYSGTQKKIQVYTVIVASEKKNTRGGDAIRNPKKSRYRLL